MIYDMPSIFDEIGDAIAEDLFQVEAVHHPKDGGQRRVRIGWQAPHVKISALGEIVDSVQARGSGLARDWATARKGETVDVGPWKWALTGIEPYGGAQLVRLVFEGPVGPA